MSENNNNNSFVCESLEITTKLLKISYTLLEECEDDNKKFIHLLEEEIQQFFPSSPRMVNLLTKNLSLVAFSAFFCNFLKKIDVDDPLAEGLMKIRKTIITLFVNLVSSRGEIK